MNLVNKLDALAINDLDVNGVDPEFDAICEQSVETSVTDLEEDYDIIQYVDDTNTRPFKPFIPDLSENDLAYLAGMTDADGYIAIAKTPDSHYLNFNLTQSIKGVTAVHFFYDKCGGRVKMVRKKDNKGECTYACIMYGEHVRLFLMSIQPYLVLKKREVDVILEFYDIMNERHRDWSIEEDYCKRLSALKHSPHDEISPGTTRTAAYFAGFFDGDGNIDTPYRSSQRHRITQKTEPICQFFREKYGGNVYKHHNKTNNNIIYTWEIWEGADEFLRKIAPFVIGKKKQVDLVLNMKPGEAPKTAKLLAELKGGGGRIKENKPVKEYKLPVKQIPPGVVVRPNNRYQATIGIGKVHHSLGIFDDVESASERCKLVRKLIRQARARNEEPDLSQYLVTRNHTNLPKGVHHKDKRFQAKVHHEGKAYSLGCYDTIADAKAKHDQVTDLINAAKDAGQTVDFSEHVSKGRGRGASSRVLS